MNIDESNAVDHVFHLNGGTLRPVASGSDFKYFPQFQTAYVGEKGFKDYRGPYKPDIWLSRDPKFNGNGAGTSIRELNKRWQYQYAGLAKAAWLTMKQQSQLSDFCQVLEQTKVFRQHKKTATSYAQLLDGGQSFTVLAPVNGTFNKDSLLRLVQTAVGDSIVEQMFVLNHLSRSNVSVFGAESSLAPSPGFRLANTKYVAIGQNQIGGVAVAEANCRTHNGTLHVMKGSLPYNRNLYEVITSQPQFAALGQFIRSYDEDDFDENASLSSGMVDGVPVYVDSVVIERNRFLEKVALLGAEDSSYVAVVPSLEGWQKAYEEAKQYFIYDESVSKRDSIQ
jgi:hypothetical protein